MIIYPEALIPHDVWKHEIAVEDILNANQDVLIGRWVKGSTKEWIDYSLGEDMPILKEKAIDQDRMFNMSCSLLGALFLPEHFKIVTKDLGSIPWVESNYATIQEDIICDKNYKIENEIFVIAWRVLHINNMRVPYSQTFISKDKYDGFIQKAKLVAENRIDDEELIVLTEWNELKKNNDGAFVADLDSQLRVSHNPTNLNYWHFLVDAYPADDDSNPVIKRRNAWQKSLALNIWNVLSHCIIVIDNNIEIPQLDSSVWLETA